jgi:hypothetical protein
MDRKIIGLADLESVIPAREELKIILQRKITSKITLRRTIRVPKKNAANFRQPMKMNKHPHPHSGMMRAMRSYACEAAKVSQGINTHTPQAVVKNAAHSSTIPETGWFQIVLNFTIVSKIVPFMDDVYELHLFPQEFPESELHREQF